MKQKERHSIYELIAIAISGFAIALTVPALMNAHDTVALLAAGLLSAAWAGWIVFFFYRMNKGV